MLSAAASTMYLGTMAFESIAEVSHVHVLQDAATAMSTVSCQLLQLLADAASRT